jgi:hypothetical protein
MVPQVADAGRVYECKSFLVKPLGFKRINYRATVTPVENTFDISATLSGNHRTSAIMTLMLRY